MQKRNQTEKTNVNSYQRPYLQELSKFEDVSGTSPLDNVPENQYSWQVIDDSGDAGQGDE